MNINTKRFLKLLMILGLGSGPVPKATALRLDFASMYSIIRFDGNDPVDGVGTFLFSPPAPTSQFTIYESDGTGSARDRQGRIDGNFRIGPITVDGARQTAPVLGEGTLRIHDGTGHDLTGTLRWEGIITGSPVPVEGHLNPESVLNFTGIAYDGQVADLVTLASAGVAQLTLNFQFVPGRDLTMLTRDGSVNTTSFSGSIVTIPEPATWALWGLGLAGLACGTRRKVEGHRTPVWRPAELSRAARGESATPPIGVAVSFS